MVYYICGITYYGTVKRKVIDVYQCVHKKTKPTIGRILFTRTSYYVTFALCRRESVSLSSVVCNVVAVTLNADLHLAVGP